MVEVELQIFGTTILALASVDQEDALKDIIKVTITFLFESYGFFIKKIEQ